LPFCNGDHLEQVNPAVSVRGAALTRPDILSFVRFFSGGAIFGLTLQVISHFAIGIKPWVVIVFAVAFPVFEDLVGILPAFVTPA
jgi:hypothetical protein